MSGLAPGHVPHYFCFFHRQQQAGWSIEGSRPETMSIQVNQIAACRHAHVLTNNTINTFTSVTFYKGKKKSWETYCSLDSYRQSIIQQMSIQQVYVSKQLWRSQESWRVFFYFLFIHSLGLSLCLGGFASLQAISNQEPEYLGVDCGNEFPTVHASSGLLSLFSVLTLK